MSTLPAVITDGEAQTVIATWSGMTGGDDGAPVRYAGAADRTAQVVGTFNGATVTLQGSLDGSNWASLTDAQGNAIAMTSAGLEAVTELVRYVRPVVTGGSGASITVMLMMRTTR